MHIMERHRLAHMGQHLWQRLQLAQEVQVVKLHPEGHEAARYPAVVVAHAPEDDWVALRAVWTYRRVELDGLVFAPGDDLIEWFSSSRPFNAFAVLSPAAELRGWYANVTYPAYLEPESGAGTSLTLVWHDLYLDLVGLPDATFVLRDEDELEDAGLAASSPDLHREILAAADELIQRFTAQELPFLLPTVASHAVADPRQSQNESV